MKKDVTILYDRVESNQIVEFSHQEEKTEDLLYEFLKSRSPTTERSYREDLKAFFNFTKQFFNLPLVENGAINFKSIKRIHLSKYRTFLDESLTTRGEPYAPNSINRKLSSVASFFQFLLQREVIDKNPAEFVSRPKRNNARDTEAFDQEEIKKLFALIIRRANPLHRSILILAFTTGMRNHELRNIRLKDFELRDGVKVLRYTGKGQKTNIVPIHPAAAYHLGKYTEWMEKRGRPIQPDDFLFQSSKTTDGKQNQKLSHTALGYVFKKWCRQINMTKRITPHSARASYISSLLAAGIDVYDVAKAVNHASVNTTCRYDKRKQNFRQSPVFALNFF